MVLPRLLFAPFVSLSMPHLGASHVPKDSPRDRSEPSSFVAQSASVFRRQVASTITRLCDAPGQHGEQTDLLKDISTRGGRGFSRSDVQSTGTQPPRVRFR